MARKQPTPRLAASFSAASSAGSVVVATTTSPARWLAATRSTSQVSIGSPRRSPSTSQAAAAIPCAPERSPSAARPHLLLRAPRRPTRVVRPSPGSGRRPATRRSSRSSSEKPGAAPRPRGRLAAPERKRRVDREVVVELGAWRASSSVSRTSWIFSPGRMPMTLRVASGASASAMSVTRMLGILGTKTSPPCIRPMQSMTKSTACSSVIQKRVIASSVIVSSPVAACCLNSGITLPRLPTTLP